MYFISATRLQLSSFRFLPVFMLANGASVKQLLITPGFVCGKELIDKGFTFWTLTMWEKDADMKLFRNSESHRKAMQNLPRWCREATYTHWMQNDAVLPGWKQVHERMVKEGIVTKVRNPSPHHSDKSFPAIRWEKAERSFKSAK